MLAVGLALAAPVRAQHCPLNGYRELSPDGHPLVADGQLLFQQLTQAARHRLSGTVELVLVDTPEAIAETTKDGCIYVSWGALDRCWVGRRNKLGAHTRARLALVLAHEISHLTQNHFGEGKVTRFRGTSPRDPLELAADFAGATLMLRIGIAPDLALRGNPGFFQEWLDAGADPEDRSAADERGRKLKDHFERLFALAPAFYRGTLSLQLGHVDVAIVLLESVLNEYEGREVAINLALAYYLRAVQTVARCPGGNVDRFLLPVLIEDQTSLDRLERYTYRGEEEAGCFEDPRAKGDLGRARELLEQTLRTDPEYLPAQLARMALLVFDRGKADEATIVTGPKSTLGDGPGLVNGYGLAQYLYATKGMNDLEKRRERARQAIQILTAALRRHPDVPYLPFNLARILVETGDRQAAQKYCRDFLRLVPRGPWAEVAREQLECGLGAAGGSRPGTEGCSAKKLPKPPLELGPVTRQARRARTGWSNHQLAEWRDTEVHLLRHKTEPLLALELERASGTSAVVTELRLEEPVPAADVEQRFGFPERTVETTSGRLLIYPGKCADPGRVVQDEPAQPDFAVKVVGDRAVAHLWFVPERADR
jgi:tetratricopeptide (TPR) repeat protein